MKISNIWKTTFSLYYIPIYWWFYIEYLWNQWFFEVLAFDGLFWPSLAFLTFVAFDKFLKQQAWRFSSITSLSQVFQWSKMTRQRIGQGWGTSPHPQILADQLILIWSNFSFFIQLYTPTPWLTRINFPQISQTRLFKRFPFLA